MSDQNASQHSGNHTGQNTAGRSIWTHHCISVTVVTATVLFLLALQGNLPLWMHTDNYWLASVLDGLYASENYSEFINPVLAGIIKIVGNIFPGADAFTLFGEAVAVSGLWCVLFVLQKSTSWICYGAAAVSILVLNPDVNLLHLPFTSLTAWFFCSGCFLLYAVIYKEMHKCFIGIGSFLILMAVIYRETTVILLLPFVLLIIVSEWLYTFIMRQDETIRQRKLFRRRTIVILAAIALACLALFSVKHMTDASEKYKDGVEYSLARAELVDFSPREWNECEDALKAAGYTQNDYESVRALMLADTDQINTSFLHGMAALTRQSPLQKWKYFVSQGLKEKIQIIAANKSLKIQALIILVLLFLILISGMHWLKKCEAVSAVLGAVFITLVFTYLDHMPSYLVQAVWFGIWLVFACVLLGTKRCALYRSSGIMRIVMRMIVILGVGGLLLTNSGTLRQLKLSDPLSSMYAKEQQELDFIGIDDHEDTMYIWNVYQFDRRVWESSWFASKKLLPESFLTHNIVDGEWQYGQPYFQEYLKRIGMVNPMKALIEREHTYYVSGKMRTAMVKKFIRQHYGIKVETECVGYVTVSGNEIPVWKFKPKI